SFGVPRLLFGRPVPGTATTAETGGIVSDRLPPEADALPEPNTTFHDAPGVAVGTVTCAAASPLLKATTISCLRAKSIRETTSTASFACRMTDAPVDRAGYESRRADNVRSCVSIGLSAIPSEEPVPIGGPPTRVWDCQSLTS